MGKTKPWCLRDLKQGRRFMRLKRAEKKLGHSRARAAMRQALFNIRAGQYRRADVDLARADAAVKDLYWNLL